MNAKPPTITVERCWRSLKLTLSVWPSPTNDAERELFKAYAEASRQAISPAAERDDGGLDLPAYIDAPERSVVPPLKEE